MNENELCFNTTVTKNATLMIELDVAKRTGYGALEIIYQKVTDFLASGHSEQELTKALHGFEVKGIGALLNIERQGADKRSLIKEAENIMSIAKKVNAKAIQIVTGPLDYRAVVAYNTGANVPGYTGLLGYDKEAQLHMTRNNLMLLSDIARDYGILLYLEALSWTPLNSISLQQQLLESTGRDNVKMVVDFWHCYTSGDTPEALSRLDADLIYGVHVCDSLEFSGGIADETVLRDVPTGEGVLNLQEWVSAVKATGYKGWWSSETFCRKLQFDNSYRVSSALREQLKILVQ